MLGLKFTTTLKFLPRIRVECDMHEDDLDEDDEADALASSIERRGQLLFALPVGSRESEMATAGKFLKYGRAMPARKKHLAKLASSEDKKVQWAYLLFKILEAKVPDSELGRFIVSKRARVRSFSQKCRCP